MKLPKTKCRVCGGSGKAPDFEAVGPILRAAREREGPTMREIARAMGLSASYLSDLERGRRTWSPELIERYEAALRKRKA